MTYTIYAGLVPEVSKELDKLAKKAIKYGTPFSYSMGEEHPQTVTIHEGNRVNKYTIPAVDIEVQCDGLIRANGWTVRAKVEHGDKGNIVTGFGDYVVKPEWYTVTPHCDHCNTNRYRAVTFFVEHEDGSLRQVGRTCLKGYTGINPATAVIWAEVQNLLSQGIEYASSERSMRTYTQMYEVLSILAHACDMVKEFGYRKSTEPASTREKVEALVLAKKEASEAGLAKAQKVIEWLTTMDPDKASDLEHNCIPLALSGYARAKHIGRLAYMPVAYDHYLERIKQEEERKAAKEIEAEASGYVGNIGERLLVKLATAELVTSWDGAYGTTWLYKFTDESGNVFIWYASRPCKAEGGGTIKATVKDHKERDGVKQTIITRCSLVA